ncbi:MAG: response regulator [Chloroflexi bacterium]|nr:MAG: response regulator [Chloroflexota bacterium]
MDEISINTPAAGRILMVEDSALDAELTMRALDKVGLAERIIWLRDGVEALAFFFDAEDKVRPPHLMPSFVLLDNKLPRVSGLEVLERLKKDERTRMVPVVMFTSSEEYRDLIRAYELGVNSYVVKPINYDEFNKTLEYLGQYWLFHNISPHTLDREKPR